MPGSEKYYPRKPWHTAEASLTVFITEYCRNMIPMRRGHHKSGNSPNRGGEDEGPAPKSKNHSKFGLFDKRGIPDFQGFPKCKCRLYMLQLNKR